MAIRHGATSFRNYHLMPNESSSSQYVSEWISLEGEEFYKIEGFQFDYDSGDHFTVSMEFEQEDTAGHHHAMKEV